jgi:hypothetical protein
LEACPLSLWLHAGLTASGFTAILTETRHVRTTMTTDWNDLGIPNAAGMRH